MYISDGPGRFFCGFEMRWKGNSAQLPVWYLCTSDVEQRNSRFAKIK